MTSPSRESCVDAASQQYRDALADRDAMTAEDAARAAGARSEEEVRVLAGRIRAARQPEARPA